tara:strand:+ start:596 stop:2431 length:1836 start_codon:yes stop_codon:yes gene_type:complete
MKLPRYQKGIGMSAGSRSLTAGVSRTNIGQEITQNIQSFIQSKIAVEQELAKLEYESSVKKQNSLYNDSFLSWSEELDDRSDTENWDSEFQLFQTGEEEKAKLKFGDKFPQYEGDFRQEQVKQKAAFIKFKRGRIVSNYKTDSLKEDNDFINSFSNTPVRQMPLAYKEYVEKIKKDGPYFSGKEMDTRYDQVYEKTNEDFIQAQLGNEGNLNAQLKLLKNPKFELYNIEGDLIGREDDYRQKKISSMTTALASEIKLNKAINNKYDLESSIKVSDELITFQTDPTLVNIPEGVNPKDYFYGKINDLNINDLTTKESLRKRVDDILKGDVSKDSYGKPDVVEKYFTKILLGQYKEENRFLTELTNDPAITPKGVKWLTGIAQEAKTKRDESTNKMVEMFLNSFKIDTELEELQPVINMTKLKVNEVTMRLLSEGEKRGISPYSMLQDSSSKYYIVDKIFDIYNTNILKFLSRKDKADKDFRQMLSGDIKSADYYEDKREEAYGIFFDADPIKEGDQFAYIEGPASTDEEGKVIAVGEKKIDESQTLFLHRMKTKPKPPRLKEKQSIAEYGMSKEYQKYRQDLNNWLYEGGYGKDEIPSFKTFFGQTDRPVEP